MANRKDSKGRVLRTGESQRKDGIYMYRYTDFNKKRVTVYASTLKELREKEKEIQNLTNNGVSYLEGNITLTELIKHYKEIKQKATYNTKALYDITIKLLQNSRLGNKRIKDVKSSDLKLWLISLSKEGRKYNTIQVIYAIIKAAYRIACTEDIVMKTPCNFSLSSIINDDSIHRRALTDEECNRIISFSSKSKRYRRSFLIFTILLETGIRAGELCGLTLNDIDLQNKTISISHQLIPQSNGKFSITPPKSRSGIRVIPMTESVYQSFREIIELREKLPNKNISIDGYADFIFLTRNGNLMYPDYIGLYFHRMVRSYNESHPNSPLEQFTPHVLRHTFCTKLAQNGMNVKNLQYLMGHSNIQITLNIYAHTSSDSAAEEMLQKIG